MGKAPRRGPQAAKLPQIPPKAQEGGPGGNPRRGFPPDCARLRLEVGQRPLVLACGPGYGEVCGNS